MTTFLFRVRNVPAALYKALGGFATNGVNMTKLESYQEEGTFNATMFFADIEGHPGRSSRPAGARRAVVLLDADENPRHLSGESVPQRGGGARGERSGAAKASRLGSMG